ncbi:MAG: hypothetical protein B6I23_02005 [Rickettsiaceae bacterium 4572_127]|nr:MAG: hypothetical protein B6I23_02005 [Rickettsiaceae bacterium 4572_127]
MEIDKKSFLKREAGFGLLEMIFALGILMAVSPFIYNQMNKKTKEIQSINLAKQLDALNKASQNYIAINSDNWKVDFSENLFDQNLLYTMRDYGLTENFRHFSQSIKKYQLMSKKFNVTETDTENEETETNEKVESFLIIYLTKNISPVQGTNLLEHLGNDAGYAEESSVYGNKGAWKTQIEGVNHAIVYRLFNIKPAQKENTLLSRSSNLDNANRMEVDLSLGVGDTKFNIENVHKITCNSLQVDNGRIQVNHLKTSVEPDENELINSNLYAQEGFFYNTLIITENADIKNLVISKMLKLNTEAALSTEKISAGSGALTIYGENNANLIIKDNFTIYNLNVKNMGETFSPKSFVADYLKINELIIETDLTLISQLQVMSPNWIDEQGILKSLGVTKITDFKLTTLNPQCNIIENLEYIYKILNPSFEGGAIECFLDSVSSTSDGG